MKHGNRPIGFMLLGSGSMVTLLGIGFFFNSILLRLGNLLFLIGVPLAVGPSRLAEYLSRPNKRPALLCLVAGIALSLFGKAPMLGMIVQTFGLLNLFGNMFPMLWAITKNMPVISSIFNDRHDRASGNNRRRYDHDRYYDDDRQRDGGRY